MPNQGRFRECTPQDQSQVSALLAQAFAKDPILNFLTAQSKDPEGAREIYFRFCFQSSQRRFMEHDGRAATLWVTPGATVSVLDQMVLLPAIIRKLGLASVPKCVKAMIAGEKAHPQEPHYYLIAVGVDPQYQGQGIGTAIVKHTLEECDNAGIGAYLDTSNPRNLTFYERLGFEKQGAITSSPGAPPVWPMWRSRHSQRDAPRLNHAR